MRVPSFLAAAALAAVAVLGVAGPAFAHDQLLSTDPANGSTVDALPAQVTLTFSDTVQNAGAEANQVKVMDASCKVLNDGALQIADNVVTQPIAGDATGQVTVLWRVVSRDGHPVSDEFSFTVAGSGQAAASSATPCATDAASSDSSSTGSSDAVLPWVIGGGVVVILAVVIVLLVTRSRRAGDR
ncbi:copper resistance CopC family protein [Microbacterium sp.]|uniref:copper resistance CopC family protein n=1 Tax=Microbacterium sp. TaxID=51671 RepID=UPI003A8D971B